MRYIFSYHSAFGILIFTFDVRVWMSFFGVINVRCTTEEEKSNKCCRRNHTILFVRLRETAQEYSFAVISLFVLRENSLSEEEILHDKNFYKIINQSFCLQQWLGCAVKILTLIWVRFLGIRFEVGVERGGVKLPSLSKTSY